MNKLLHVFLSDWKSRFQFCPFKNWISISESVVPRDNVLCVTGRQLVFYRGMENDKGRCSSGKWKGLGDLNIPLSQQCILLPALHTSLIISEGH